MKKLLVILLTAVMVLSLFACDKNDPKDTETTTSSPTASEPAPTPTEGEGECEHDVVYTFDGIENVRTHTGKCTICEELIDVNAPCVDEDKDNKCDLCSEKVDFVTAYDNLDIGTFFTFNFIDLTGPVYGSTPELPAGVIFCEVISGLKAIKVERDDENEGDMMIYSAEDVEAKANRLFNLDDEKIAALRAYSYTHPKLKEETMVYDAEAGTYSYFSYDYGMGGFEPNEKIGYKQISDTEFVLYLDNYRSVLVINCTYTDTVKVTSIYSIPEAPDDIIVIEAEE